MDELTTLIGALSEKLGVAASELYTVLQNQARVCIVKNSVWCIAYLAFIILAFIYIKKVFVDKTHRYELGKKSTLFAYYCDLEDECIPVLLAVLAIALVAISIVLFFVLVSTLDVTITCIFNPKFWALNQILSYLK